MICFDVSALLKAQLGESLILNVDTGPQKLTGGSTEVLEVDFFRGTIQVLCIQNGLFVEGSIKSQFGLDCARCLEPFAFPVTLELGETFRLPRTDPRPDAPYAVGDDHKLDLAPLLREQTWIAIPMKPLCRPDCKGLCPQCGANLNREPCICADVKVDPRLAVLKELL